LNSIEQKLPGDSILFCMDVKGLYPGVPKKEGLDACKQALDNRPNPSIPTDAPYIINIPKISVRFVRRLLK
jgi:hypothetical protein